MITMEAVLDIHTLHRQGHSQRAIAWLWVWQNIQASYYAVDSRRSYAVVKEHFGEDYQGCLVHDCYSAQNNTVAAHHQLCHPHLIRDLNFAIEAEYSRWAWQMKQLLLRSAKARDYIWGDDIPSNRQQQIMAQYEDRLEFLIQQPLSRKNEIRLQKRFRKHQPDILFFMSDPNVPQHNNDSEKAIRQAKVKQKISGGCRSGKGADRYARLLSIFETAKKHNLNVLNAIQLLSQNQLQFNST